MSHDPVVSSSGRTMVFPRRKERPSRWRAFHSGFLPLWLLLILSISVISLWSLSGRADITPSSPPRLAGVSHGSMSHPQQDRGADNPGLHPFLRATGGSTPTRGFPFNTLVTLTASNPLADSPFDPVNILKQLWTSSVQGITDFVKNQFLDWASTFGFMYITPAALTYKLSTIQLAGHWSVGLLDGIISLILVVGGYNVVMRHHLGLPASGLLEWLPRLALAAVIANLGFFFVLPQLIELNNTMCISLWMAFGHAGVGDFTLPLGAINWVEQPFTIGLFMVIDFLVALLLTIEQLARIGFLDLLIVFAPLGIICAALPQTRTFFHLWAISFFCTLFVQVLQVGAIALGSALIVSFGHASSSPIVILVGIACMYLAFKLPTMLLSHALRSSMGSIHQDLSHVVTGVSSLMGFLGA